MRDPVFMDGSGLEMSEEESRIITKWNNYLIEGTRKFMETRNPQNLVTLNEQTYYAVIIEWLQGLNASIESGLQLDKIVQKRSP